MREVLHCHGRIIIRSKSPAHVVIVSGNEVVIWGIELFLAGSGNGEQGALELSKHAGWTFKDCIRFDLREDPMFLIQVKNQVTGNFPLVGGMGTLVLQDI